MNLNPVLSVYKVPHWLYYLFPCCFGLGLHLVVLGAYPMLCTQESHLPKLGEEYGVLNWLVACKASALSNVLSLWPKQSFWGKSEKATRAVEYSIRTCCWASSVLTQMHICRYTHKCSCVSHLIVKIMLRGHEKSANSLEFYNVPQLWPGIFFMVHEVIANLLYCLKDNEISSPWRTDIQRREYFLQLYFMDSSSTLWSKGRDAGCASEGHVIMYNHTRTKLKAGGIIQSVG